VGVYITNSKTHFKGWVLNPKGKLLARFNGKAKRSSYGAQGKPLIIVKNGYFYEKIVKLNQHMNEVVKYKIRFKKN
jgi:hypothetical protein